MNHSHPVRRFNVFHLNVFTSQFFSGNPATVVWKSNGMTPCEMQQLAHEFNTPETIFIDVNGANDGCKPIEIRLSIRFFTPTKEVDSCGHGSLAAAYVADIMLEGRLSHAEITSVKGKLALSRLSERHQHHQCHDNYGLGVVLSGVNVLNLGLDGLAIQSCPILGALYERDMAACVSQDLVQRDIVSTGTISKRLLIMMKSQKALKNLKPDMNALTQALSDSGLSGVFCYSIDSAINGKVSARMFAPNIGINEDPVNGNSSLALIPVLQSYFSEQHLPCPNTFTIHQGFVLNREGTVNVGFSTEGERDPCLLLSGNVTEVYRFHIELP